jgi:N-dimethylarginine dimethylaminohydrolase
VLICGELCKELNAYLDAVGVQRIVIEPNNYIDPAVKSHADMAVLHLGGKSIIADKNQTDLIRQLEENGFTVILPKLLSITENLVRRLI